MLELAPYTLLVLVSVILSFELVILLVGKTKIQDLIWNAYSICAQHLQLGESFREYASTRAELKLVNLEKKLISAQDQYAKWTRLQRKADALLSKLKQYEAHISSYKGQVLRVVSVAITCTTTVPIWFFRFWFRKLEIMFLPAGVFPKPVEWLLALPFMQTGTVGLMVWIFAVKSVLESMILIVEFIRDAESAPAKPDRMVKVEK